MLKAMVLGTVIECHDDGSFHADDDMWDKLDETWGEKVETVNGVVTAGMGDELSLMALFHVIDPNFEIIVGSDDVRFLKRVVQGEEDMTNR